MIGLHDVYQLKKQGEGHADNSRVTDGPSELA